MIREADLARRLDGLRHRLARAQGRRDALQAHAERLEAEIGAAKGRHLLKEQADGFLDALQTEANRRTVESFETLLSAFVSEVLPGEKPVSLDLSTERGLPALDIGLKRPDGSREDILEDNGGALTNVVGVALRLIAVVKAGAGRFLALDEADCWIAPDRVPAFYRVIEQGAERLGIQCLTVSHHDVARFESGIAVSRLVGEPATGIAIASPDTGEAWSDAAPGLRFVRLRDIQGAKDATLRLSPGVNALTGPNNRGKSTFIRALRAVFYGEARDSLVRAGAASGTIEIGAQHGRTLRFVRRPRRSPVNLWSLHEADGSVVEENGLRHETGGRSVPDWVGEVFGIARVGELDVHVAHQKFPVFLLGETPARRSAVLAIGREAAFIADMQAIHRERATRDAALVRNGERDLTETRAALARFAGLEAVSAEIEAAARRLAEIEHGRRRGEAMASARDTIVEARRRIALIRARAACLDALPSGADLARLAVGMAASRERSGTAARLAATSEALAAARLRLAAASRSVAETAGEIERVTNELGGACPTCGAPLGSSARHAHAA